MVLWDIGAPFRRTVPDAQQAPMTDPVTGPADEAQVLGGDDAQTARKHVVRVQIRV